MDASSIQIRVFQSKRNIFSRLKQGRLMKIYIVIRSLFYFGSMCPETGVLYPEFCWIWSELGDLWFLTQNFFG